MMRLRALRLHSVTVLDAALAALLSDSRPVTAQIHSPTTRTPDNSVDPDQLAGSTASRGGRRWGTNREPARVPVPSRPISIGRPSSASIIRYDPAALYVPHGAAIARHNLS